MAVDPRISMLLDIYGSLLTEKERSALDYYYNDDLSLREIADNETAARRERREQGGSEERDTISRQGVRDTIKRAEAKLVEWESKLHLAERAEQIEPAIELIIARAKAISSCNIDHGCLREINEAVMEIIAAAESLRD